TMKKAKKMALQAMVCAAFAAAMVLAGCTTEEGGDSDMIQLDGNNATIDADNTTEYENRRGFKSAGKTRWSEAAYEITIDESTGNNVMGFMFNESENTDSTKNFFLFGVRLNSDKTGLDAYLSYFPNVDEKKNLTSNVNTFYSSEAASQEETIMKGSGKNDAYFPLVSGQKRVIIHVTQEKAGELDNDPYVYVVKAYKSISADGTLTDEITLTENGAKSLRDYPNTGKTGKWDNYMGFYANVKKGKYLKGSWKGLDKMLVTAVEVAEAE
ncbi:MAG: hypothetical protein K2H73_04950, partial [Treponemataceae bacterium]|nr:hypothetical protein [Treponemataceae bacterium]